MTNSTLKTTLAAAAVALSFLAAPAAQAETAKVSRDTGVGQLIAAQGNVALRLIRAEAKAALRLVKPKLPAHATKVVFPAPSLPAGAGASVAAGARCAE